MPIQPTSTVWWWLVLPVSESQIPPPWQLQGTQMLKGPLAGSVSAVARGTALVELPPVRRRALAALHPRGGDTGDWPCRHQGDVVDVAGAWREVQPVTRGEQQLHLHDPHSQDLHRPYILLQCPFAHGQMEQPNQLPSCLISLLFNFALLEHLLFSFNKF